MTNIRLIGLMLFITAVALALAAAATRTTHLRTSKLWLGIPDRGSEVASKAGAELSPQGQPSPSIDDEHDRYAGHPEIAFTDVPIYWPLLALTVIGLGLWFIQPPKAQRTSGRKRISRNSLSQQNRRRKQRK